MSAGDDDVALSFGDSSTTSKRIRYSTTVVITVSFGVLQIEQTMPAIISIVQASGCSFLPSLFPRVCADCLHLRILLVQ